MHTKIITLGGIPEFRSRIYSKRKYMKLKYLILSALLASGLSVAHAEISSSKFISNFIPHFSKQGCSSKGVLRHCFRVKQKLCLSGAAAAARHCQKVIGRVMPAQLNNSAESSYWGSKLGTCISQYFGKQNIALINQTDHSCTHLTTAR